jgi:glycosyltransferase involved in cell wall biosynthesis
MERKIIVTMPAYNEERTIAGVLKDIKRALHGRDFQMLVVDDGSSDKTSAVAKRAGALVIRHESNCGLAQAFRTEMKECLKLGADIIIHTDADGQYKAEEIPLLLKKIDEGYDLVLGSRFSGRIEDMSYIKRFGNKAFSRIVRSIAGIRITDGQTGFRAFTRDVASINIRSTFTYTQEQIIRAARTGFRIAEVPIYFARRGGGTKSRLMKSPFHFAYRAGLNLLRTYRDFEPLKFFGSVGLSMIAISAALGLYIIRLFLIDPTIIDRRIPTIMLIVLFFISGLQILLFGFLADMGRD